jgi:hypothetical protein
MPPQSESFAMRILDFAALNPGYGITCRRRAHAPSFRRELAVTHESHTAWLAMHG